MNLLCPCPKSNRATSFFLCDPTAQFHTCVIALDNVFKIGMGGRDSLIECEFYQR